MTKTKRIKIEYKTAYDSFNRICGYVMAQEVLTGRNKGDLLITENQYKQCLKKRSISGIAGVIFMTDKPVWIAYKDFPIIQFQNGSNQKREEINA